MQTAERGLFISSLTNLQTLHEAPKGLENTQFLPLSPLPSLLMFASDLVDRSYTDAHFDIDKGRLAVWKVELNTWQDRIKKSEKLNPQQLSKFLTDITLAVIGFPPSYILEDGRTMLSEYWDNLYAIDDGGTVSHSVETAVIASQIAQELGEVPLDDKKTLFLGALYHDIGKSSWKVSPVINSPRRLTDEERKIVGTHTDFGFSLLGTKVAQALGFPKKAAQLVKYHHMYEFEKLPDDMRKDPIIPILLRIVQLADNIHAQAFDRNRSYREPQPLQEVLGSLRDRQLFCICAPACEAQRCSPLSSVVYQFARTN